MNTPKPHWEVRLSSLHAVVLVGLITGSMVAAFYLGFLSGERTGFESGQEASMAHTARVPIPDREIDIVSSDATSRLSGIDGAVAEEVYDQLAAPPIVGGPKVGGAHGSEDELPALGRIESAPARHLADRIDEELAARSDPPLADSLPPAVGKSIGKKFESDATLGALDEPRLAPHDSVAAVTVNPTIANSVELESKKISTPVVEPTIAPKRKEIVEVKPTPKPAATQIALPVTKGRAADSGIIRAILPKGWYAQVAAPRKISEAEALASKLKRSGFPVLIERANVRGAEYFRVVVGPETDRVQVERLMSQLKRERYEPFPRAVK